MKILEVSQLSFSYDSKKVLNNISLDIIKGESFGIIGPNGCGKTTLIKEMTGILPIKEGKVVLMNKSLNSYGKKELAKFIAVVEQEGMSLLSFTVNEVVAMGRYPWMRPFASLTRDDCEIINDVLEAFDLWDKRNQPVETLSGGERQLVSLARAMVQGPQVLFLDEPTTFLDIGNQLLLMQHVRRWQKDKKLTVVMVLHDLNLAAQYCDRLALINQKGYIETIGNVNEVIKKEYIEKVYNISPILINHPVTNIPQILA